MKKFLNVFLILLSCVLACQTAWARGDNKNALNNDLKVLTKGSEITYPIKDGTVIMCYAKKLDGSIDAFNEYNEYYYMKNGKLYSDTFNKIYKPERKNALKVVDKVKLIDNNTRVKFYDTLWEWSARYHARVVKINLSTGEYFMKGGQDNWTWYRNIIATGYCTQYTEQ